MYLSLLKKMASAPKPGHWPSAAGASLRVSRNTKLDRAYEVADQCLNSWKEAHAALAKLPVGEPVTSEVHQRFVNLCRKAFIQQEDGELMRLGLWQVELVAYAVICAWDWNRLVEKVATGAKRP